jgi:hypothetical protein
LHKRRDRTIQRAGDGAEEFGFAFLDQAVRPDDMHTGFDHLLIDFRCGQREAIERGFQLFQPAFFARQELQLIRLRTLTKTTLERFCDPSLGQRVPDRFICFEMRVINGYRCVYDQAFAAAIGRHA